MATGRRGNPVLRPYEQQQTISGQLSPRADVHYQKNYIGDALEKLANLTDNIYRSMERDKYDKYERDIKNAKDELFLKLESTENPDDWYSDYKAFKDYKEQHGKELLGDRLYNKWLGDAEHGYASAERDDLDFQMRIVPKVLKNAKALRVENATKVLTDSITEKTPEESKKKTEYAYKLLDDQNLFSVSEREAFKNQVELEANKNAFSSLLEGRPDKALELVESESFKKAIKDPKLIEEYRKSAQNAILDYRTNQDVHNLLVNKMEEGKYVPLIMSGELRDINVILNDSKLTRPQKDFYIKMMGERISKGKKGDDVESINALTKIKRDFDDLFVKEEGKRAGFSFRDNDMELSSSGMSEEQADKYNEIKIQKALDLQNYIIQSWAAGYISDDTASTKLSAIQGVLGELDATAVRGKINEEKVSSNAYYSGLSLLENAYDSYGIVDIQERDLYDTKFFNGVKNYLAQNNLTNSDFINLPRQEKDAIVIQVAGNLKKDMVDYTKFFERVPNAEGQSSNSIISGAKARYSEKVKAYNDSLNVDNWAHFVYSPQQQEELRDLASESYREEINSIVKKQNSIESQQQALAYLTALEEQENEEFLIRYTTAREKELEALDKSSIVSIPVFTGGVYASRKEELKEQYENKKAYLKLLKEGDEETIKEVLSNKEEYEKFITEQLG